MITSILIVINIIILELILSIDNAAVLATLVKRLPKSQQNKALTYGIVGAYVFRGLALLFASLLIKITWLKLVGGLYLIYLAVKAIIKSDGEDNLLDIKIPFLNVFWSTVVSVEILDLIFSIDNVFAVVAFTPNVWLIWLGVFVGILAMRFAATKFIKLLESYPVLEKTAYYVIGVLGIRLALSFFYPATSTEMIDIVFSICTLLAFAVPIIWKKIFKK
jgi:YkoY family integral membrane protein